MPDPRDDINRLLSDAIELAPLDGRGSTGVTRLARALGRDVDNVEDWRAGTKTIPRVAHQQLARARIELVHGVPSLVVPLA